LERGELGLDGRVAWLVRRGEVRPDARDDDAALVACLPGRRERRGPVRRGGPAPAQPGVRLQVHPRRAARPRPTRGPASGCPGAGRPATLAGAASRRTMAADPAARSTLAETAA